MNIKTLVVLIFFPLLNSSLNLSFVHLCHSDDFSLLWLVSLPSSSSFPISIRFSSYSAQSAKFVTENDSNKIGKIIKDKTFVVDDDDKGPYS